jgi:hypothetical protein
MLGMLEEGPLAAVGLLHLISLTQSRPEARKVRLMDVGRGAMACRLTNRILRGGSLGKLIECRCQRTARYPRRINTKFDYLAHT